MDNDKKSRFSSKYDSYHRIWINDSIVLRFPEKELNLNCLDLNIKDGFIHQTKEMENNSPFSYIIDINSKGINRRTDVNISVENEKLVIQLEENRLELDIKETKVKYRKQIFGKKPGHDF